MQTFDFHPRTRLVFGAGAIERLGELARELNFRRTLLVPIAGWSFRACRRSSLYCGEPSMSLSFDFETNPHAMIEPGALRRDRMIDSITASAVAARLTARSGYQILTNANDAGLPGPW